MNHTVHGGERMIECGCIARRICCWIVFIGWMCAGTTRADFEPPVVIRNVRLIQHDVDQARVSIIIQDGRITAVGANVDAPGGAESLDGSGLICYPGFIDAATMRGFVASETGLDERRLEEDEPQDAVQGPLPRTSAAYRRLVHPHWSAADRYDPAAADHAAHRKAGFTTAQVIPPRAIIAGSAATVDLGDAPRRRSILRAGGPMFFEMSSGFSGDYPTTTAGAIALFRQTLLDAQWRSDLREWAGSDAVRAHEVPVDRDLDALQPLLAGKCTAVFHANSEDEIIRALDLAAEQHMREPVILGGAEAWKAAERIKHDGARLILSLALAEEPKTPKGASTTDFGMGILDKKPASRPSASAPATSSRPTEEPPLFDEEWEKQPFEPQRVYQERKRLWNEALHNAVELNKAGIAFTFSTLDCKSPEEALGNLRKIIEAGLPTDVALESLTTRAAETLGIEKMAGHVASGMLANLVVMTAPLADKNAKTKWVFIEGKKFEFEVKPPTASAPSASNPGGEGPRRFRGRGRRRPPQDEAMTAGVEPPASAEGAEIKPQSSRDADATTRAATQSAPATSSAPSSQPEHFPQWATEIEADRKPAIHTGGNVLIRHVNVLTLTEGDKQDCDVLVRDGKIMAVGQNLATSKDVLVLDLPGYYVCPGIIDCHSHMGTSGGLNEGSISVSPEVRMGDVVNHRDVGLYRAAAGGVTMIHTMHGSANTIGGQNVVLRMKYGKSSAELKVPEAHRTIKFALGENVKRSNGGGNFTRFPASRTGVEVTLRRSFAEAVRYRTMLRQYEADKAAGKNPKPVRPDLRLQALCEIMDGVIWVHSHCYRSDEILRLLQVAEDFGFRIAVLQHVLEGYRIIPEIVRHGCAASTFSDWWTYKLEAADAIPYNAARMEQGGVVATVNSDSGEVVRHLNLEAAKCVRFGGLSANDAMRLCTLNGAISLGMHEYCGSVTPEKWADLAIFDGHPLDTFAKCVMTLVGGEVYFQHRDIQIDHAPPAAQPPLQIAPPRGLLTIPNSSSGVYVLRGATIHTVSGEVIANGVVVFSADGIRVVGGNATPVPDGAAVIDAVGLDIWPGLINASCSVGMAEIGSVAGGNDVFELGTFQPDLFAATAVHPHSDMIPVTRNEGVTTAMVIPGGGTIAGRASIIHTDGWTMPEMLIRDGGPLVLNLPSVPADDIDEGHEQRVKEHREAWKRIDEFFDRAKLYADVTSPDRQQPPSWFMEGAEGDDRLTAMTPYVTGRAPVLVNANEVKPMLEAVKFARKRGLKLIINGGRDAWKIADLLAAANVPVIFDSPMGMPGEFDPWDSVYRAAGVMDRAGVPFCFGGGQASLAKQLGTNAGMAVAHGLKADRAMYALTLGAAKILGIDHRYGSIEAGKAADLIVCTGNPCQATARVLAVFINGHPCDMTSKHTRLDEKFAHRPAPHLPPERKDLKGPPPRRLTIAK